MEIIQINTFKIIFAKFLHLEKNFFVNISNHFKQSIQLQSLSKIQSYKIPAKFKFKVGLLLFP